MEGLAFPCPEGVLVGVRLFPTAFACPRAAAGAVSSSLSDSSLLEEPSPGLWVSLVRAGDDVLAGEFIFPAFQGAGVSARTGGTLADAGVVGVPFLGEAVALVFIAGFAWAGVTAAGASSSLSDSSLLLSKSSLDLSTVTWAAAFCRGPLVGPEADLTWRTFPEDFAWNETHGIDCVQRHKRRRGQAVIVCREGGGSQH